MTDAPQEPPASETVARWLRVLADAVEGDPALAARLAEATNVPHPPSAPEMVPAAVPLPQPVPDLPLPDPPVLKHRRRSSRYGAPIVAGRATGMGVGVPDPVSLYASEGEAGLRTKLDSLRAGSLRAIIRTHGMDPDGKLPIEATERRMITLILAAAKRAQPDAPPEQMPKRGNKKRG